MKYLTVFPNDAERRRFANHESTTCSSWLIGSMNECYVEINQDFTKVKTTTNSILISRLVYDCDLLCNASSMDEYKYSSLALPPTLPPRPLGDERMRECICLRDASWKSHSRKNRLDKFFKTTLPAANRDVNVESQSDRDWVCKWKERKEGGGDRKRIIKYTWTREKDFQRWRSPSPSRSLIIEEASPSDTILTICRFDYSLTRLYLL